jgi:hypothetical protein
MGFIKPASLGVEFISFTRDFRAAAIYVLLDPRDGLIRYLGRTSSPLHERLAAHIHDPVNFAMATWLKEMKRAGVRPEIQAIATAPVRDAHGEEAWWLFKCSELGDLLNHQRVVGSRLAREVGSQLPIHPA